MKCFSVFFVLFLFPVLLFSQVHHEFLANVNYQNFAYSRLDSFPGVTYIFDNTAYDQNNKRFFFQGSSTNNPSQWTLFTVNALNGNVISQTGCPSNMPPNSHVCCIQYDNSCDTLYGIYYEGSIFSSCWIEPATGIVHLKQTITGMDGYASGISTYDENDHRLIFMGATLNGSRLMVVDAFSGNLLSASTLSYSSSACCLEYDNTTHHLYGIRTGATPSLDSIEMLTGMQHLVKWLPSMGFMQNGISAIDEPNHKYIFCGKTQPSNNDSLFTIDLQTGSIVNEQYYAYANSASITGENIIFYCVDQLTSQVYALNWGIDSGPENVHEQNAAGLFSIVPNPSSSSADIFFGRTYKNAKVCLYNSLGALILTQEIMQSGHLLLSLENLEPGIYFISVTGDNECAAVQRLVVQ